jgi:hypothetical protein
MKSKEHETYKKAKAALLARRLKFAETLAEGKANRTAMTNAQRGLAEIHLALRAVDEGLPKSSSSKPIDTPALNALNIPTEGPKVW